MELTSEFDVVDAATDVVEDQLTLLEALCDANKYRMDESSRLMCRCPSCHGENVALSGRVYVLADAANGSIEPGDLLTTSDRPGHAMKATDPSRTHGAILGKAMSALDQGQGMILVLVTLQ